MKLFLSWSGDKSRKAALALHAWLPQVINEVQPFLSTTDIGPGERGLDRIARELADSKFGIVCLTADNWSRPWVNYEAGALSKEVELTRVIPILLDVTHTDISGPLSQFQYALPVREDMRGIVHEINKLVSHPRAEKYLDEAFDMWWPRLEEQLEALKNLPPAQEKPRDTRSMLEEMLGILRSAYTGDAGRLALRSGVYVRHKGANREGRRVLWDQLDAFASARNVRVLNERESHRGLYLTGLDEFKLDALQSQFPTMLQRAGLTEDEVEMTLLG